MSAGTYAYVSCDFVDRDAPPRQKLCNERVEEGSTVAQARKAARSRGWLTGVRPDGSKPRKGSALRGTWDYCPAHKPAPKEG